MLETGISLTIEETVTDAKTAKQMASGGLAVYATPAMIAFMETCSLSLVAPHLEEGQSTVGSRLDVSHISPTPVGMKVYCTSTLTEIDRRRLVFKVTASDSAGIIGEGTHERFIIDNERFMSKARAKRIE